MGIGLLAFLVSGCAASKTRPPNADPPVESTRASLLGSSPAVTLSPIDRLWEARRAKASDFSIGSGDVIQISVPDLPGLQGHGSDILSAGDFPAEQLAGSQTVRVDGLGDINLALLGHLHVAGLTEEQLRNELVHRLETYIYDPQVQLFVKSYSSREVAVSGEVHSPGMYIVNGPRETMRNLIIRAGGTTDNAAHKIILTPAREDRELNNAGASGDGRMPLDGAPPAEKIAGSSYVIDLTETPSAERYLSLPIRPGDTIYVPKAGTATVVGWVVSPKTMDITSGLTVLGAVSAAGGTLFAADTSRIKIIRQDAKQEANVIGVNLNNIKAARAPDVLVQANDVIEVPYSAVRIPGYALYYAVQGLVTFAPAALLVGGIP
jgi:protein involved in polysaccharide export with SLBB domain